jgi:glutamyl/glutaminyl-tRNA synthetase
MAEKKGRILIVEDDTSIAAGLRMNLRHEGFEVELCGDGEAGLRMAIDLAPDLIVLDVMLPAMNGFEVLRELRRRGNTAGVIMLTAKGQEEDKVLGLDLGADDYVQKPFGLQELIARIYAVHTRFPPEPNGYLHIGHAKSICLNFGLAEEFGGVCNLRFDDTNPEKEEDEYVRAIQEDVRWLGFDWGDNLHYASDRFDQLYEHAQQLIRDGKAYVDSQTAEQIRETRGTIREPGTNSPYRERSVEENLALFEQMKNGELDEGAAVLRAKIDMASPNLNMRDPAMYRIRKKSHHRTGDTWSIYPMYDWAHGQCDSYEGITHSVCTLEFEHHRPLYDWFLDTRLHADRHPQPVRRRRGGQARRRGRDRRSSSTTCAQDLEQHADRVMVVLDPVKVVIDQLPRGTGRRIRHALPPERRVARASARCPSAASSTSSATTSWRTRPRSSSASPRARRCGCATPTL